MEVHYPEIFIEYEKLDVDCVLFSTGGASTDGACTFAAEALGHAASNVYWVSYSTLAPQSLPLLRASLRQTGRGQRVAL